MSAGDEAASAAIQVMEQRARSIDQLSELMIRILENLSQRSGYTKDDNKGIKALLKHLGNGRDIDITPFAKDDVQMLDEILRSMRIAFVMVYDQKEEVMLLMTRDSDREVLKEALHQYVIDRDVQKQEKSYKDNTVRDDFHANKSVREHVLSDFSLLAHQEEKMIHEQI